MQNRLKEALVLGMFVFLGLSLLGYFIASSPTKFRLFDRTVSVKGLAEREVSADIALWPIRFTAAGNDLEQLVSRPAVSTEKSRRRTTSIARRTAGEVRREQQHAQAEYERNYIRDHSDHG